MKKHPSFTNKKREPRHCPKCKTGKLHYYIILGENKLKHKTHNLFCDNCTYAENRKGQPIYVVE